MRKDTKIRGCRHLPGGYLKSRIVRKACWCPTGVPRELSQMVLLPQLGPEILALREPRPGM